MVVWYIYAQKVNVNDHGGLEAFTSTPWSQSEQSAREETSALSQSLDLNKDSHKSSVNIPRLMQKSKPQQWLQEPGI